MPDKSKNVGSSDSPLFNMSLHKGIDVLMSFGPDRRDMNLSEIADAAGLSKSAAQRFAYTLETLGFLRKDSRTKRFSLTPKTVELGYRYLLVNPLIERANPYLLDLNKRCGETVNMAEPDGTDMVYVARFATSLHASVHMPVGRRLPMFCTSSGRALLSAMPPDQAYEILKSSPRPKFTPATITDIDVLMGLLEEAREVGYSYSRGEYYRGDLNISLVILDAHGCPTAAVNISAPSVRWTPARLKRELVPELIETGRLISTTPPSPRDVEPFRQGYGTSARLLNPKP
ncbi:MAG: IclR family transcriptional regulator [Burkholderiaceae bacterium]